MINFVKNNVGNTSFKKIIRNKSTNKSNTANFIVSQLKEPFPEDNQNRSIVRRAEDNGFDIYLEKIKRYTHVHLLKIEEKQYDREIGVYSSPQQFDVNKFINIYKSEEHIENLKESEKRISKYLKIAIWIIIIASGYLIHKCDTVKQDSTITKTATELIKTK